MMNSSRLLKKHIDQHLPNHHFEFILTSADYMFRKPSRMLFELAVQKSGLLPEDIWFCGDNFVCDIEGAGQCGMTPVWYTAYTDDLSHMTENISYIQITDWKQLRERIEKLP